MASKVIGVANVRLGLQSAAFTKGMKSAQSQLVAFEAVVGKVSRGIVSFKNALLAAAGAGGIGFLIKQSFASGDAVAKMSDRLGIATETLAAYKLGADLAGVSIDELDLAFTNLQRSIVDANQGEKSAKDSFALLGLDPQALRTANPEQQIVHVAEAISRLNDQALKTDLVKELFGKGGRNLERFLSQGAAGLEKMRVEAERLGIAFNRTEFGRLEQANDSITMLGASIKALADAAAVELAPRITLAVDALTDWITNWKNVRTFAEATFETIATGIDSVVAGFGSLEGAMLRVEKTWLGAKGAFNVGVGGVGGFLGGGNLASRLGKANQGAANAAAPEAARIASINMRLDELGTSSGKTLVDRLREALALLDKMQSHLLRVPDLLRRPIDDLVNSFIGPPDSLMGMIEKVAATAKASAVSTSGFSIGFREVGLGLNPFNTGTIFGEQQGELVGIEKRQLTVLERIEANTANLGEAQ